MKKILVILLVAAIAAPAIAEVQFTAVDNGGGQLKIAYTTTAGEAPRGVALKISLTNGATCAPTGTVSKDAAFNTYIDYAFSVPSGYDIGVGHPLAKDGVRGVLESASSTFVVCMGVLDETSNQLPGPTSTTNLITLQLVQGSSSTTQATVSADTFRGPDSGVVGSILPSNLPLAAVTVTFGYTLNTSSTDGGNVIVPGEGAYPGQTGLTAIQASDPDDAGYYWVGWTGASVGKVTNAALKSTTILMDADATIQATWQAESISTPSVAKTTAAPAIATRVNGGRTETFVASGAASTPPGDPLEYLFIWGDTPVNTTWVANATQTHVYTYAAPTAYNVTVQARSIAHPAIVSAVSAPLALTSEAVKSTAGTAGIIYADWCSFGRKICWAYTRNCRGDADGKRQGTSTTGYLYVSTNDLLVLAAAWNIKEPPKGVGQANINVLIPSTGDTINGICADFNRDRQGTSTTGYLRVSTNDLPILAANWNVKEPPKGPGVPSCLPVGIYHYVVDPPAAY